MATGSGAGAAAAGASAAAAIAQAIKASGAIVRLESSEFQKLLIKIADPLVVIAKGGLFSTTYQYLTSYRGLAFYCKSSSPLELPGGSEVIQSKKIWMPG
jgi:hypothetical protein